MHACDGDIINIDGTGTSRDPYPCQNEKGLDLAGLVLRSYNSRAFISCRTNGFRFFCGMASRGVILEEITFVNTSIHLFECSLNVVAGSQLSWKSKEHCPLRMKVEQLRSAVLQRKLQFGCSVQTSPQTKLNLAVHAYLWVYRHF